MLTVYHCEWVTILHTNLCLFTYLPPDGALAMDFHIYFCIVGLKDAPLLSLWGMA